MKKYYSRIDHSLTIKETSSGLPVYMVRKNGMKNIKIAMMINFGAENLNYIDCLTRRQIKVLPGTAHFLEHKLFESRENNLFQKFMNLNGEINAYTDLTKTVFQLGCMENIKENLGLFLHTLQNPYITFENVEKERDIIIQEINMYRDNPSWRVYSNFLKGLYIRNYIRHEIAGTEDDIRNITLENLNRCYEDFYTSDNMAMFIIGNFDEDYVMDIVEGSWKVKPNNGGIIRVFPYEPNRVNNPEINEKLGISKSAFTMGFKELYTESKSRYRVKQEILLNIILEAMLGNISKLKEKLYSENLIDSTFSFGVTAEKHFIFSAIGGESREPARVREYIFEELIELKNKGIDWETTDMIKSMMIGNIIKSFDNDNALMGNLINYRSRGEDYFNTLKIIEAVDDKDIMESIVEFFDPKLFCMSSIVPK